MMIEISYAIIFAILAIVAMLTVTRKMSMGIGITGIAFGLGVAYVLQQYMQIIIAPIGDAVFYAGTWTIPAILGLTHLVTMLILMVIAIYNLMSSGGKIIWA